MPASAGSVLPSSVRHALGPRRSAERCSPVARPTISLTSAVGLYAWPSTSQRSGACGSVAPGRPAAPGILVDPPVDIGAQANREDTGIEVEQRPFVDRAVRDQRRDGVRLATSPHPLLGGPEFHVARRDREVLHVANGPGLRDRQHDVVRGAVGVELDQRDADPHLGQPHCARGHLRGEARRHQRDPRLS